jgi:hypothetical protein
MIDDQGSLPLHYALSLGMRWEECIKKLVDTNFHSLAQLDGKTGLKPFMLSAVGPRCDLNTTFHMKYFFGEQIVAHVLSSFDVHEESIPTLTINSSEISPAGRASNPT